MQTATTGDQVAHNKDSIVLRVRYAPAKAPLVDPHASKAMTLAEVKATALTHFQLAEGAVDGGTKTYQLAFDDIVQTDLSITLGSLVTHGNQVELLLIEQFEQG